MGRPPCCDKSNVKKGSWTEEEDAKIIAYVSIHGTGNWSSVPKRAGLNRCAKSCRLRYTNYLRPDLKREGFTPEEEHTIVYLHSTIGSRWSTIAQYLPGRTDNDVKNYWNTKLKKKLFQRGIDPITHKPISQILLSLGVVSPRTNTTTTTTTAKSGSGGSGEGGVPRIGCLNRDLKNVFMSRSECMVDPVVGIQEVGPTPGHDLLTQLQAIKLVADVSNASMSSASTSELPRQSCVPCTSSSSSSNAAPPQTCSDDLSWSDFLVDDVILCIDGDKESGKNRMEYSDQVGKSKLVVSDDSFASYAAMVDMDGTSGDAFVKSMLSCDSGQMDWELPEFALDDDPLAGVVD